MLYLTSIVLNRWILNEVIRNFIVNIMKNLDSLLNRIQAETWSLVTHRV